ncbi:MAG: DUF3418 domain-containing protein [Micropruina glycogenica]
MALPSASEPVCRDVAEQLKARWCYRGFVAGTPDPHWQRLPRYLHAVIEQPDGRAGQPFRDRGERRRSSTRSKTSTPPCARATRPGPLPTDVAGRCRLAARKNCGSAWFAQSLGTSAPISAKRVRTAMAGVTPPR